MFHRTLEWIWPRFTPFIQSQLFKFTSTCNLGGKSLLNPSSPFISVVVFSWKFRKKRKQLAQKDGLRRCKIFKNISLIIDRFNSRYPHTQPAKETYLHAQENSPQWKVFTATLCFSEVPAKFTLLFSLQIVFNPTLPAKNKAVKWY